jgi:hypothetical protein
LFGPLPIQSSAVLLTVGVIASAVNFVTPSTEIVIPESRSKRATRWCQALSATSFDEYAVRAFVPSK